MGGKVAGFIFTVVIPLVVAAMIPHIPLVVGWAIITASLAIGAADLLWSFSPLPGRQKVGPVLMMAAGLVLLGAGVLWYYRAHAERTVATQLTPAATANSGAKPQERILGAATPHDARPAVSPTAGQNATPEVALLVQCFPDQPRTVPRDGRVHILKLLNIDGPHGGYRSGMSTMWAEPGSAVALAETVFSELNWDGIRCELTNYGREPLQDIRLSLSVEYHEAEKLENGFRMGPAKKKMSWPVEIEAVGSGDQERKTFWIANITNDFAVLKFEAEATATGVGTGIPLKVRVSQPQSPHSFLGPISRKR